MTGAPPSQVVPHRRLHPLTPFIRSARMLTVIVAALSWQGYASLGFQRFLAVVAAILVIAFLGSVVSWLLTGYEVVNRELRIHEGVLNRRIRTIPLERLQAVDINRKLLARLTGLAELRLEVAGGGKAEAPLAYLTMAEAAELRVRLLTLAGAQGAVPAVADRPAADEPERPIHRVTNRDLLVSQLLTPQAWAIPLGLAGVGLQFWFGRAWGFIAIASTLTALAGVVVQPFRRVLDDWNFRVARGEAGLRLRHGLLETRSQTIPVRRVQAVGITHPLLWRVNDWVRVRLDVAGYHTGAEERGERHVDRLLPVGRPEVARMLIGEAMGEDIAALLFRPVPRRARWLAPLSGANLGASMTHTAVASRTGWLTTQTVVVTYPRIQSVRVRQGPLQRLLRLASVHVDTAGGLVAALEHRDRAEAYYLAGLLADHARLARSQS